MQPLEISRKLYFSLVFVSNMVAKREVFKTLMILKCMDNLLKVWALAPPIDSKTNFACVGNKWKQTGERKRSNSTTADKIKKSSCNPNLKMLFCVTNKMNLEALLCSFELGQGSLLKKIRFYIHYFCVVGDACTWFLMEAWYSQVLHNSSLHESYNKDVAYNNVDIIAWNCPGCSFAVFKLVLSLFMVKVDSSPRQQNAEDGKMALALLPTFVMSEHLKRPARLMQTDRCCWDWWRIHSQQHHSGFPALYPSYSWQMQWDQLFRDFRIWSLSYFPFTYQDLLHFYSSFPYNNSNPFLQSTVQMFFTARSLKWVSGELYSWHCQI